MDTMSGYVVKQYDEGICYYLKIEQRVNQPPTASWSDDPGDACKFESALDIEPTLEMFGISMQDILIQKV